MSEPAYTSIVSMLPAERESETSAPNPSLTSSRSAPPPVASVPWGATWILLTSLSAILAAAMVIGFHADRGFFVPVLAMAVCLLAALFDAWTTRIPNPLTYPALLVGLGLSAVGGLLGMLHQETALRWLAAPSMPQSWLGFLVCAGIGIVGLVVARVGGGDLKLLAALGALLGLSEMGYVLMVALLVALVYSLINLAAAGRLNSVARFLAIRTLEVIYLRKFDLAIAPDGDAQAPPHRRDMIPMAIPLALGLLLAEVLQLQARFGGSR